MKRALLMTLSLWACDPPEAVQTVCVERNGGCECTTSSSTIGAPAGVACDRKAFLHCCMTPSATGACSCSNTVCLSASEVPDCRLASAAALGSTACHPISGGCAGGAQCVPTPSGGAVCVAVGLAAVGSACGSSAISTGCVAGAFCATDGRCHRFCRASVDCGPGGVCNGVAGFPVDVRLCG